MVMVWIPVKGRKSPLIVVPGIIFLAWRYLIFFFFRNIIQVSNILIYLASAQFMLNIITYILRRSWNRSEYAGISVRIYRDVWRFSLNGIRSSLLCGGMIILRLIRQSDLHVGGLTYSKVKSSDYNSTTHLEPLCTEVKTLSHFIEQRRARKVLRNLAWKVWPIENFEISPGELLKLIGSDGVARD